MYFNIVMCYSISSGTKQKENKTKLLLQYLTLIFYAHLPLELATYLHGCSFPITKTRQQNISFVAIINTTTFNENCNTMYQV